MGLRSPKVRDGCTGALLESHAVAIHLHLPQNTSANVNIVNLFTQGSGDVIEFRYGGFEATTCLINGKACSLAKYLHDVGHDIRLPLVADCSGSKINVE